MTDEDKSTNELRDLYRELILDHARNPRHFGRLDDPTHTADGINPLCGDKLKMYFRVDGSGRIVDAKFEGTGCAISVASASLLTDTTIGMRTDEAMQFFSAVVSKLSGKGDEAEPTDIGKLKALEGVKEFPARVKCATLPWHALRSALNNDDKTASTE